MSAPGHQTQLQALPTVRGGGGEAQSFLWSLFVLPGWDQGSHQEGTCHHSQPDTGGGAQDWQQDRREPGCGERAREEAG